MPIQFVLTCAGMLRITSVLLVVLPLVSSAQNNDWNVRLSAGDTLSHCALLAIDDSLLTLDCNMWGVMSLNVDSVDFLSRHKESRFGTGAGYGALAGAALGAVIGLASYEKPQPNQERWGADFGPGVYAYVGGAFGIIGGLAVGGAIGAIASMDETYELLGRTRLEKVMIIRTVMSEEGR